MSSPCTHPQEYNASRFIVKNEAPDNIGYTGTYYPVQVEYVQSICTMCGKIVRENKIHE